MRKIICSAWLLIYYFLFVTISAQSIDSCKIKHFGIGLGIPYHHFRDRVSSDLAYKGLGLAELNIYKIKINPHTSIKQLAFSFGTGSIKPDLKTKTDFNKSATVLYYGFSYAYLKHIHTKKNKAIQFYAGGKISSDAQYIIYPTVNNVRAYNFNWLSIQLSALASYNIQLGKKLTQLWYQIALPVFTINARPAAYSGLVPTSSIWNQNESSINTYFKDLKLSSLHNNFNLESNLAWDISINRNKLRLAYAWLFQYNTVSIHSLNSVRSSVSVSYLFHLKNRTKK
jgi:hypothetical protein